MGKPYPWTSGTLCIDCGIEATTGPLGQGFAMGVGAAIVEALLPDSTVLAFPFINHYSYALVSDGDLMEGVAQEAASLAGHLKLGKLIYLFDNNRVSLQERRQFVLLKTSECTLKLMDGRCLK